MDSRLVREKRIVSKMIKIYCHDNHHSNGSELCKECEDLKAYAYKKLLHCPLPKTNLFAQNVKFIVTTPIKKSK